MRYTQLPRTTLWLVQEGTLRSFRGGGDVEVGSFYLGKSLMTNVQVEAWKRDFVRVPESPEDDGPALGLSFHEAGAYCAWYAEVSGKAFRLPTEAEWELACRAGTEGEAFASVAELPRFAWCAENAPATAPVIESRRANPFGLHDLLGLAWEWTDATAPLVEGSGATGHVAKGGSLATPAAQLSCTARLVLPADLRRADVGFRIARSL